MCSIGINNVCGLTPPYPRRSLPCTSLIDSVVTEAMHSGGHDSQIDVMKRNNSCSTHTTQVNAIQRA